MQTTLGVKNIVIVGEFNLPQFDKYFFIKHGIIEEEELLPISAFGSDIVIVQTPKLVIQIVAQQMIISVVNPELNSYNLPEIAMKILESAQIKIMTALGINFHWYTGNLESLEAYSKEKFFKEDSKMLTTHFSSEDALFGFYASTGFKDSRLKLNITPNILTPIKREKDITPMKALNYAFNFHFDVPVDSANEFILRQLKEFDEYFNYSKTVTESN